MLVSRLTLSAAAAMLIAGAANAEEFQLTSSEQATVVEACELGLPLIPVESDFGHQTGQFALPISNTDGDVRTALIIEETSLQAIPECRGEVEAAIAERERERDTRSS